MSCQLDVFNNFDASRSGGGPRGSRHRAAEGGGGAGVERRSAGRTELRHGDMTEKISGDLICSLQPPGSPTLKQHIQTIWYTYHQRMNENTGYTQWFWL